MPVRPLTPKQERFVAEYLIDLNATAAYKRAGYRGQGRTAENNASRLLGNAGVAAAIAEARARQQQRTEEKADDVIAELKLIGHSDIGDILDFSGDEVKLKPASQISATARRCISGIKVRRYTEGRGDSAREVEVIEFKLWSKDAALEKLGRHKGLWDEPATGRENDPIVIKVLKGVSTQSL